MAIKAIIIEDNPTTMDVICQSLEATEDIEILGTAANATLARELIGKGGFDIMLCDLGLPDGSGIDLIKYASKTRAGGSSISPLIARQLLQQLQPNTNELDDPLLEPLSSRETDVLNLLARGFTYAEIAGFLTLSEHTIRTYVRRIYHKLQVNSRSEAVFEASSRGIIDFH
ncbi:MAG: LuxR family transcriptional regulator [Hyphomonadaceae bacterium]|nr:MAG: LuxR family transcriptional regulator [Hyphomonadaceae bacterium]